MVAKGAWRYEMDEQFADGEYIAYIPAKGDRIVVDNALSVYLPVSDRARKRAIGAILRALTRAGIVPRTRKER